VAILDENRHITLREASVDFESSGDSNEVSVVGSLVGLVTRLDDELTQSFQLVDAHSEVSLSLSLSLSLFHTQTHSLVVECRGRFALCESNDDCLLVHNLFLGWVIGSVVSSHTFCACKMKPRWFD
jgi:hypothetical protein